MNLNTLKMLLSEVGPLRLTVKYDYTSACDDMEQINLLLKRKVFKVVEGDGLKIYRAEVHYLYNDYYKHLTSDPKVLSIIKKMFKTKIKRYTDYLSEYYTVVHGEPFIDGKRSKWYDLFC